MTPPPPDPQHPDPHRSDPQHPALTLAGRAVVVTGAGRGLGLGYARELARRGARVVVNDLGTTADGAGRDGAGLAEQAAAAIRAAGGTAVASTHDASSPEGTAALVDLARAEFGTIDGVVANAGIYRAGIDFPDIDDDLLARMASVHTFGAWRLVRAAWPHFAAQRRGRVVLVTSAAGLYGMARNAAYATLKAGVVGLTRTLAAEGEPHGIAVNAVAPLGFSRMTQGSPDTPAQVVEALRAATPADRVAPVVAALLADEAPATGEVFSAGGGHVSRVVIGETRGIGDADRPVDAEAFAARYAELADTAAVRYPVSPEDAAAPPAP